MRRELARKAFHLASLLLPAAFWILPRRAGVAMLLLAAAVALAIEVARSRHRGTRYHFLRRTRTMLRPHERRDVSGATYMAFAYAAAALLFPKAIAVVAMFYNGLGDAAAALVGRRWGRHRLASGKSWEGFAAAVAANLAVGLAVPGVGAAAAVAGAFTAAGLELARLPLDDNLRVVLGGGLAAWLVTLAV